MTAREDAVDRSAEIDQVFDDLVCEVSTKLEVGEAVDLDAIAVEHPEHVDRLRKLLPTLQAMAELGHSGTALLAASPESRGSGEPKTGVLGDFRIVREIGRGGMGVVYEAEQISLGRRVALKVLPFAALADARQLQRFQNEARAAASLDHPNIVQVYSVGCERAVHFYAMQYIDGQTLARVIQELRELQEPPENGRDKTAVSELTRILLTGDGRLGQEKLGDDDQAPELTTPAEEERAADGERAAGERVAEAERSDAPVCSDRVHAVEGPINRVTTNRAEPSETAEAGTRREPQAAVSTEGSMRTAAFFRSVARLGIQAAEALEHAHQLGVVHRDVKPSNLILDIRGKLWISDFGLAQTQTGPNITMTGDILGTLRYMSPEQAEGNRRILDHHTDIYSLGVTLYELLTLQPPFDSDDRHKLIHQIIDSNVRPLRGVNASIPKDLETIVLKAMAAEPEGRYTTAQELADDLRRFLEHKPIRARRPSLPARFAKWSRRHLPVVWAAVATLVICIVALALSTVQITGAYESEKAHRERAVEQQGLAEAAAENEKQARTEADRNLYVAQVRLAQHDWEAGQISRLHEMLDNHFPKPGRPDLRGWEWYYLLSLCHSELLTLHGHEGGVYSVDWSPEGQRLASGGQDGSLKIWHAATGQNVQTVSAHTGSIGTLAWSPDGRRLASAGGDCTVRICDAARGQEVFALEGHTGSVSSVSWSPDSGRLASGGKDGTIRIWDTAAGEETLSFGAETTSSIDWSPDGQRLASGHRGKIKIWDAVTGREVLSWPAHGPEIFTVAWSPDGDRVAAGGYGEQVQVWEAETGRELLSLAHSAGVESVSWSPDGKYLASAARSERIRVWDVANGEEILTLRGHRGWVFSVAWSPDGMRLASAGKDSTVKTWDASPKQEAVTIEATSVTDIAWCPIGNRLASTDGGTIEIWDPIAAQTIATLRGYSFAWSPDGNRLAVNRDRQTVIVDASQWKEVLTLNTGQAKIMEWSPDRERLALGRLGGGDGNIIRIWDISTKEEVLSLHTCHETDYADDVWVFSWSPDGRSLASAGWDGTVKTWDAASGKKILTLRGHVRDKWINAVVWSPDGTRLASGGWDQTVKVWDTSTGQELVSLHGHTGAVWTLAWSPDGRRLASAGFDGGVRVWHPASGQEMLSLRGELPGRRNIESVAWSHDGMRLAAVGGGRIRIWDANVGYAYARTPASLRELARHLAAQGAYEEAIAILEELAADFPEVSEYADMLAQTYCACGCGDEQDGHFDQAIADYTQALSLDPNLVGAYRGRGRSYAALGQWKKARDDFETVIELGYDPVSYWPALLLAAGDHGGYSDACRQMLDRSSDINTPDEAGFAAWACALAPNAVADFDRPIQLAEKAVKLERVGRMWIQTHGALLYRAGRWEEALQRLCEAEEILASQSESLRASPAYTWFFLAMVHHRLRHTQEAVTSFHKAVEWADEVTGQAGKARVADLRWDQRVIFHLLRREAEELLKTQAPEISDLPAPEAAQAYYSRGRVHAARGECDQAIADYIQAIRLQPEAAEYHRYRAKVHAQNGDPDQAIADYTEAIRLRPEVAEYYYSRGEAYADRGVRDEAIANITVRLDPSLERQASIFLERGKLHKETGDFAEAVADLTKCLELEDDRVPLAVRAAAHFWRAHTYWSLDQDQNALPDYEQALKLQPDNVAFCAGFALFLVSCSDPDIRNADRALELARKARIPLSLGAAQFRKGYLDAALESLERSENRRRADPAPSFFLAMVHHQRGDLDRAHEWYDTSVQRMEESIKAPPGLKYANIWRRYRDEAAQMLDSTSAADLAEQGKAYAASAADLAERGEFYADKGDLDAAISDFTEAIRLDPTYALAYASRGIAYAQKFDATLARHLKLVEKYPESRGYPDALQSFEPTGDLRQAIADYLEFIRLDATYRDNRRAALGAVYVEGGSLRLEQGNAEAAIADYTEAIRICEGNARAFCGRGIAHFRLGHVDEALADCLEAIRLEPNNALYDPDCLPNYFSLGKPKWREAQGIDSASDMPWVSASSGDRYKVPLRNQHPFGFTLRIAGRPYQKFLLLLPHTDERPADIVFDTSADNFVQFKADVGPTWSGGLHPRGSVRFQVLVDGNLKAETPVLHPGDLHTFRVDVAGAAEVILRLLNGGDGNFYDEAAWGNARFLEAGVDDPLEPSLKLRSDSDPAAWLFAAMLHSKLGNEEEARTWYNKAAGWVEENDPDNEDLCSLQAKAEQVLGTALSDPTEEEKSPESEEDSE